MLRNFAIFLILLVPAASAGISTSTDTLPPGTWGCSDDSRHEGGSTYWSDNNSYSSQGWSNDWEYSQCSSSGDVFRADVESNEHEVASAHVGDRSNQSESESRSYSWSNYGSSWEDSYYSYYQSNDQGSYASQESAAREASVSTFAGAVDAEDGCERSNYGYHYGNGESYYSRYSDGSTYSSGSDSSYYGGSDTGGCGREATATTDVTTVSAGDGSACTYSYGGQSYGSHYNGGYDRSSYYWGGSDCASGPQAQVGAAALAAGSRQGCDNYGYESYQSSYSENASQSYRSNSQFCDSRFGLFGTDGLAIYYREQSSSYEHCHNDSECETESWTSDGVIVIEHDLAGSVFVGVPSIPTMPSLPTLP